MFATPQPQAAAWAPWLDGKLDWLTKRDIVTAAWLTDRAQTEQTPIVVQGTTHAHDYRRHTGPLGLLARNGKVATYKSPVGHGATYVHHTNIRLLATAMGTAGGHSIAATEIPTFPMQGWAMALGALNLATGEVTVDTRTDEQVAMIERLVDQLYNGWSHKEVGRRATAHYLPRLAESGMTYAVFVGSLIAVDPGHLDSKSDIDAMKKALPPVWEAERQELEHYRY